MVAEQAERCRLPWVKITVPTNAAGRYGVAVNINIRIPTARYLGRLRVSQFDLPARDAGRPTIDDRHIELVAIIPNV